MPESIFEGRRALWLGAAALVGLAAGLAAGFALGRLTSGRDSATGDPRAEIGELSKAVRRLADAQAAGTADPRAGIGELSKSVAKLSDAVKRLGEARPTGPGGGQPPEARPAAPEIPPGVKFHDTFEKGTDGWFVARFAPAIIGEVSRTEEEGQAHEGRGALSLSYMLEPGKIPLAVRMGPQLRGMNRLSLWIRTVHRPAEVIIGAQERDESAYQTMLHLEPGEGWKRLELDLANFVLGDDSRDENGRLDFHEIRSVSVADVGGFFGQTGENVLLIDEVVGERRAPGPAPAEKPKERF